MRKIFVIALGLLFSVGGARGMQTAPNAAAEREWADDNLGKLAYTHKAAFNCLCDMFRRPSVGTATTKRFRALVDRGMIYEDADHRWHIASAYAQALARRKVCALAQGHEKAFDQLDRMFEQTGRCQEYSAARRFKALVDQGMIYEDQNHCWHVAPTYAEVIPQVKIDHNLSLLQRQHVKALEYACLMFERSTNEYSPKRRFKALADRGIICEDQDHHWHVAPAYAGAIAHRVAYKKLYWLAHDKGQAYECLCNVNDSAAPALDTPAFKVLVQYGMLREGEDHLWHVVPVYASELPLIQQRLVQEENEKIAQAERERDEEEKKKKEAEEEYRRKKKQEDYEYWNSTTNGGLND